MNKPQLRQMIRDGLLGTRFTSVLCLYLIGIAVLVPLLFLVGFFTNYRIAIWISPFTVIAWTIIEYIIAFYGDDNFRKYFKSGGD